MTQSPGQITKTVVTTASGDIKAFGDFLSKAIVAQPKIAVGIAAVVFFLLGHFV